MKRRFGLKICAAIVACLFTANVMAPPKAYSESSKSPTSENQLISDLSPEVCGVEEIWTSPGQANKAFGTEPLVILLQEAHVNYGAQKHIVATLEHFQNKFHMLGLPETITIALEGNPALKEIDPVIFRAFPQPKVTREVTDSFMRDGRIDGAEFYAINSNHSARLFGIDDISLYQKNLQSFKTFRVDQEKVLNDLKQIRTEIEQLKEKVYAKPLKDLEESRKRFGRDTASLRLHLKVLATSAKLKNVSLRDFPLVLAMQNLLNQETKLDPKTLEEKMRAIKSYQFFDQMNQLEEKLYEELAFSRDEKLLVSADRYVDLLEKLAALSLTQNDFNHLKQLWPVINSPNIWKSLDDLSRRRNSHFQNWELISGMLEPLNIARDFYLIAKERDQALTQNLDKLMKVTGQKVVFVIAGGFHTEGMTSRLRDEGISYIALTPMANPDESDSLYWKRLSGVHSEIQNFIAQVATVKPTSEQDDPEFEREAGLALIAHAASLGSEEDFKGLMKEYVEALKINNNVTKDFVQKLLEQFNLLRARKNPGPQFLIPLNGYFFFSRRWIPDQKQPLGGYWYPAVPQGYQEVMMPQVRPNIEAERNYYSLAVVREMTQVIIPGGQAPTLREARAPAPVVPQIAPRTTAAVSPAVSLALPAELQKDPFARRFNENPNRKYNIIGLIGKGGMGAVYEGEEIASKRRVAIKAILGVADEDAKARLIREAKAMSQIKNNSVPKIYEDHTNLPNDAYYIMEKLQGTNLKKVLEKQVQEGYFPLNKQRIAEAIKLTLEMAKKIKTIHDAGYVHRDLKPDNIFMVSDEPIIIDMGLAFEKDAKERLSQTGMIMGTPAYMSPEQAQGAKIEQITNSSDIFSLGVILYQLLTNSLPFEGASSNAIIINIVTKEPIPPGIRSDNKDILPALDAVVMKALAKNPAKDAQDKMGRFYDMSAFIEDLLKVLKDYEEPEAVEQLARSFDDIFQSQSNNFSQSLDEPINALVYVAQLRQQMKWYNRVWRQIKKHWILYSVALLVGAGCVAAFKINADRTAQQQIEERKQRINSAKNEIDLATQDILAGNFDSAIKHLQEGKKNIGSLDERITNEIDLKTRLAQSLKTLVETEVKIKNKQRADLSVFKNSADELSGIVSSEFISNELRFLVQLTVARVRLLQAEPDFIDAAKILNTLQSSISENLRAGNTVPQKNLQDVNKIIVDFFEKVRNAPYLSEDVIPRVLDFGKNVNDSLMIKSFLSVDKANLGTVLGYLASLPSPVRNLEISGNYYKQAVQDFDQIYQSETNPAVKEYALWMRGLAESKSGDYAQSIKTFDEFRTVFSSSSRIKEAGFKIADNWNRIGVQHGQQALASRLAQKSYTEDFDSMKKAFESAQKELDALFEPLSNRPMADLDKIRVQSATADSYLIQMAMIAVMYRNLLQFSSKGVNDPLLGKLYNYRNSKEKVVKDSVGNPNLSSGSLTQYSDDFLRTFKDYTKNLKISIEDEERLDISARYIIVLGMINGLQNADIANEQKINKADTDINASFIRLKLFSEGSYNPQARMIIAPYMRFYETYIQGSIQPGEKTFLSEGLATLGQMFRGRREAIVGHLNLNDPLFRTNKANAEKAEALFANDPALQLYSSIMETDAQGKSLGAAPDIFNTIDEEKRLSPVIMEFNENVLKQLVDRRSDFRRGKKSLPIFFLMRNPSEFRRINKEYPGLWNDYRIGLLGWKHAPMSEMTAADVDKLMNLGHLKIYLRSIFPEGEVSALRPDQVVFANDSFGPNWGEDVRRVKFDHDRFNNDEQYRSAYLASAFYLVNHGKGEGVFQYNAKDQTLELLPAILADLVSAWKALKQVLVAA